MIFFITTKTLLPGSLHGPTAESIRPALGLCVLPICGCRLGGKGGRHVQRFRVRGELVEGEDGELTSAIHNLLSFSLFASHFHSLSFPTTEIKCVLEALFVHKQTGLKND